MEDFLQKNDLYLTEECNSMSFKKSFYASHSPKVRTAKYALDLKTTCQKMQIAQNDLAEKRSCGLVKHLSR